VFSKVDPILVFDLISIPSAAGGFDGHGGSAKSMTYFHKTTQTFLMRVWLEPRELESASPVWRGMIECMHDHERCYFHSLNQLAVYIGTHLEQMGANPKELFFPVGKKMGHASFTGEEGSDSANEPTDLPRPKERAERSS
jgi:hypothetical protein